MISVGQQIGGYTMLQRIGQGTVGEVYLAENPRTAARVAIKVLASELSQKPKVLDRFFKEARATSQLRHPGIAATLDCFVHEERAFVSMELLLGESLAAYLRRAGALALDLPFLLGLGAATAGAVGAVHATGIIHRDLKPGNIYLHLATPTAPDVTVKILDFGIARLSQEEDGPGQTASGLLSGTPMYMSPEQCRGATGIDARSDIYSLGCILYEASCGRPPFLAESLVDLLVAHVSQSPEPPVKLSPGLSPELSALILHLLAKKPEDRPQTMGDVVRALRECARGMRTELEEGPLRPKKAVEPAVSLAADRPQTRPPAARPSDPVSLEQSISASDEQASVLRTPPERGLIGANAGGTMAFNQPGPSESPYKQQLRANAGGTMLLDQVDSSNDCLDQHAEGRASRRLSEQPVPRLEIRVLRALKQHRSSATIAGAAAVVALGATVAIFVAANGALTSVAQTPTSRPPVVSDTVEIEISGLLPDSTVIIDDRPVLLPIRLPRGPDLHRIVLRPPGRPERTIEVDGTKDRKIEAVIQR